MNLAPSPISPTTAPTQEPVVAPSFMKHHRLVLAVLCLLLISGIGMTGWSWAATRGEKIVPGISLFATPIGGLTRAEADKALRSALNERWKEGIKVRFEDTVLSLRAPDEIIQYDTNQLVQQAYGLGRTGSLGVRLFTPLLVRLTPFSLNLKEAVQLDRANLEMQLREALGDRLTEGREARLRIQATDTTTDIQIEAEQAGTSVDIDRLAEALNAVAREARSEPIPLVIHTLTPQIKKADLEPLIPTVSTWLDRAPFTLTAEDRRFIVSKGEFADWIRVSTSSQPLELALDTEVVGARLRVRAKELLKPSQDGTIKVNAEGVAEAFTAPEEGVDVDTDTTIQHLFTAWQSASSSPSSIELALTRVAPRILGDGERLGIQEIIGVGRSDFSGSPSNRRRNIALGSEKVGMTLIPPGEEFSMLKVLGVIDGEHGWLPELVIKGNKTTPEFGGGLCQVGTTMFRAALASGLPITERRNHSYRVRYYEPAGTDATIYDPAPDFRFKNDLAGWILVTTRIQKDTLVYTVWGKKDGRTVTQTKPRVFNIVAAPPKKIIETLDLKPGEEKCTEKEHAGADAEFIYTVVYPDGRKEEKTFFSRYRPWQAVCLKGVAVLSNPAPDSTAPQPLTPDIPVP